MYTSERYETEIIPHGTSHLVKCLDYGWECAAREATAWEQTGCSGAGQGQGSSSGTLEGQSHSHQRKILNIWRHHLSCYYFLISHCAPMRLPVVQLFHKWGRIQVPKTPAYILTLCVPVPYDHCESPQENQPSLLPSTSAEREQGSVFADIAVSVFSGGDIAKCLSQFFIWLKSKSYQCSHCFYLWGGGNDLWVFSLYGKRPDVKPTCVSRGICGHFCIPILLL